MPARLANSIITKLVENDYAIDALWMITDQAPNPDESKACFAIKACKCILNTYYKLYIPAQGP